MTTINEADRLRHELQELVRGRARGDVPEKGYERRMAQGTVDLYRAVVKERLLDDEAIALEHHVVKSHFKLNQSALRETTQEAISVFLTPERLIRLRSWLEPSRPVTADDRDRTMVDEVSFDAIAGVRTRREFRLGEAVAGLVICGFALLFHKLLLITGSLMIGLGALGVLHALLLPTRWVEVEIRGSGPDDPIQIFGARKPSGRKLVARLRQLAAGASRQSLKVAPPAWRHL